MSALEIDDVTARADALKQAAIDLLPTLAARADETEKLRQLPAETVNDITAAGLSRLCQPRKYGGAELPIDRAADIISTLARGCASTAWVCSVYTDHAVLSGMFGDAMNADVWGENPAARISAGYHPVGKAEPMDGGCNLSGKWGWVSGCDFADWFLLGAMVPDETHGVVPNFFAVPRNEVEIEDNWHVMGLNGTGSKNVTMAGAFVPQHRMLSLPLANEGAAARGREETRPLYRLGHVSAVPYVFVAVLLGLAESFLELMAEQLSTREAMGVRLAALQSMQLNIAETAAEVDCARLLMTRDTTEAMAAMADGRALTMDERGRNRRNMAYAARLCKAAVNRLHDMTGASGIFDGNITQRKFRDTQAASRHIGLSWELAATDAGSIMLGQEPKSPFV